ncbi:MAG: SAM-dependent methyltransferase, partial [Bacteroidota bacterium]
RFLTWAFRGSHLVRHDAPLSVLRAFRKKELLHLLKAAGISGAQVRWKWAFRFQVIYPGTAGD